MPSFWADPAVNPVNRRTHPVLTSFADELRATLARLIAYVGALALLGILGLYGWRQLPLAHIFDPTAEPGWTAARRADPAFAVGFGAPVRSRTYAILHHPQGGRKDVIRWPATAETAEAELEIYQPGGEAEVSADALADLARRMPADGSTDLEAAGLVDAKFGPIALWRRIGSGDGRGACLGFLKRIADPPLQLSGWSCQGDGLPARRTMIGCMLDRLTLLASANDPKLADFFARAEPSRRDCAGPPPAARPADWVGGLENPRLRGTL